MAGKNQSPSYQTDLLHKFSRALSKSHAVIVLENLQIRSMTKSAKGDRENPGRRVAQKSCLNRAILDQGWDVFKTFLEYKQRWLGGHLEHADMVGAKNILERGRRLLACGEKLGCQTQ